MLLRKIVGELNVQNDVFFQRNCEMEMVATDGSAFTSVYVYVVTTVVPLLTAVAVATPPRRRISKR